jgi:hypothetical protein
MIPGPWLEKLLDVVLAPGLWLSVLFALIYGLLFSVWRWGGWRQLARDVLAALLGFAAGQLAGTLMGLSWLRVGQVQLLWGTAGAVAVLALGRMLWRRGDSRGL